jgi:hypothetical protein
MHPIATNLLLRYHLQRVERRIAELGWRVRLNGTVVTVEIRHRLSGEVYRLSVVADEYPLIPVAIHFLPVPPRVGESKWPYDGNFVFRTNAPRPFVCLSGVRSFVPDLTATITHLADDEIHIGAVLTNLDRALHDSRYHGPVFLPIQ